MEGERRREEGADEGGLQGRREPPAAVREEETRGTEDGTVEDRDHVDSGIPKFC